MSSATDIEGTPKQQDRVGRDGISFSCEFYPPKGPKGFDALDDAVQRLRPLDPELFTVTYGASGSTRGRTQEVVSRLSVDQNPPIAGHIACVGATKEDVHEVIDNYAGVGVRSLVAIRGDKPVDEPSVSGGYETAAELVAGLRSRTGGSELDIYVAAYPEVHPKAASMDADIENLKEKVDAGADYLVTQFFFDNTDFYRFREAVTNAGIDVPLIPGILPVGNLKRNTVFADRCGAKMPTWIDGVFAGLENGGVEANMVGTALCVDQCQDLVEHGVNRFHFYTMNRGEMTAAVWRILSGGPTENRRQP